MRIRMLGSGGSFGSPLAWQKNGNIDITNKRNFRTRSSVLVYEKETTILIDTSPDLRKQLYDARCTSISCVLFTHGHADHISGLPDMRAISLINKKVIPAYAPKEMKQDTLNHYKYIFEGHKDYRPFMKLNTVKNKFQINNIKIESFKHNHGSVDVHTYRIGNFAYSTDIKKFYNNDIEKLKNLDLWIVGLLRLDSHPSHGGYKEIMDYIKYLKPKKTIFTHMTALIDEKNILNQCPPNVFPGYDGLEITI